jgi:hypothetical protein
MFNSRLAIIFIALGLGACASGPKYVKADHENDYGHYTTQLAENRYRIVFNGGQSTSLNMTRDYALLRAAELTLQAGYDWFQVVDRETNTDRRNNEPQMAFGYERAYYTERSCGLLACSKSVYPRDYRYMKISNERARSVHSHSLEIVTGSGAMPADGGNYYDASSVAKSLWASM